MVREIYIYKLVLSHIFYAVNKITFFYTSFVAEFFLKVSSSRLLASIMYIHENVSFFVTTLDSFFLC